MPATTLHRPVRVAILSLLTWGLAPYPLAFAQLEQATPNSGALKILDSDGRIVDSCPLKHTDVQASISGFVSRVTVTQEFYNPLDRKIEAIYVFPLPQDAAVDRMTMLVGDRRVVGHIKERGEARQIYEQARAAGHVAGLLDQERPNIFTQSVANIDPGVTVQIEISYVETLKYEDGVFEWTFPMVVGPRYIPGGGSAPAPMTPGNDTPEVPDGSKITPPVAPQRTRAGHDISLRVELDTGGLPISNLGSTLHEIDIAERENGGRIVTLKNQATIPNRDFILHYGLGQERIGNAFMTYQDERGAFFTLILQPPERVVPEQLMPRELIFVLDTSGSMGGFPIEKAKETMARLIDTMRDGDTFNLITFAGNTRILWNAPRPATKKNRAEAQSFLTRQHGGGGTEMMKAINAALVQTRRNRRANEPAPIRVVCFMTDGYVGNDMAIIDAVRKNADTTRVFSFGVGNSVNRFLLDGMAHAGRGEVEYVTLESQAYAAVERFHERILAPVLTDIEIDWADLPVADVYPTAIPDLFSSKPILVHGRLTGPAAGTVTVRGNTGAGRYEQTVPLRSSDADESHDSLASLWARAKVADLMNRDLAALQSEQFPDDLKRQITGLGIEFGLMTQFTSFVAVEEMTITSDGQALTVQVPVEMPQGVSYEGVFGEAQAGFFAGRSGSARSGGMRASGGLMPAHKMRAPSTTGGSQLRTLGYVGGADEDDDAAAPRDAENETPAPKLAPALRGLAEKVAADGRDGNLTLDAIVVKAWRVRVMVTLADLSDETRAALKTAGFEEAGESNTGRILVGSVDVRKLEALAELAAVRWVAPLR